MTILNKDLRKRILEKGHKEGLGHYGSALSCLDCIQHLYANVLGEGDKFILSKGHGAMALYAVLEQQGEKPEWKVHPNYNPEKGIHATTGSLGHGLPIAVGMAFAKKQKSEGGLIYVLTGDGEMQEGSNWEALELAKTLGVDLNLFVDCNKYQAISCVDDVACGGDESLMKKLKAFGCNTIKINGHDEKELSRIKNLNGGLNAVILDTIKGKGGGILEENCAHVFYWDQNPEEYKKALENLSSE